MPTTRRWSLLLRMSIGCPGSQSRSACTRLPAWKLVLLGFAVKTLRRGKSQVKVLFVRLSKPTITG